MVPDFSWKKKFAPRNGGGGGGGGRGLASLLLPPPFPYGPELISQHQTVFREFNS